MCSRSPEGKARRCLFSILVVSTGRRWSPLRHAICGSRGSVYHCSSSYGTAARRTKFSLLRDGGASRSWWGSFNGAQCFGKAARIPQLLQATSSQELRWREVYRRKFVHPLSVRFETVSTQRQKTLFLGNGAALMARQRKRTDAWNAFACLAFGRQSQVYQSLTQTAPQCHVKACNVSPRSVDSYSPSMDGMHG